MDGPYKWRYSDASGASGPLFCGKGKSTSSGNEGRGGDGGEGVSVVGVVGWKEAKGVASAGDTATAHPRCGEDWASQLAPRTAEAQLDVDPFDLEPQALEEEVVVPTVEADGKEEGKEEGENVVTQRSRRSDLLDDDDFHEAMEDVHAWLGRILDH